jgi:hypothetical protein
LEGKRIIKSWRHEQLINYFTNKQQHHKYSSWQLQWRLTLSLDSILVS